MHSAHALSRLLQLTPPAAMTALDAALTALDTLDDRDALAALAEALPGRVADLAPEVSVALAALAVRLVPYGVRVPVDVDVLTDRPRIEWLRLRVIAGALPDAADLRGLVLGWSPDALPEPLPLLRHLAGADDSALRGVCLDWLPGALAGLGIGVGDAFDLAAELAMDSTWAVRARALTAAEFGVRFGLSLQQESRREDVLLAGLQASDEAVARAALQTCAQLGRVGWLRDFAGDESRAVHLRADALTAVGAFAEPADLPWALDLGQTPGLERACRQCLLDGHRQGAFLDADALDALLDQYDRNTAWTPVDLIRVTHVVRDALIARLARVPADDMRWIRRARLLAESGVDAAPRLLERLLGAVTDLRVATAFIDAARRAPGFADANGVLGWLERAPEAALAALRVKVRDDGHLEAIEAFANGPAIGPRMRRLALDTLWAQLDSGLTGRTGAMVDLLLVDPESDLLRTQTPVERLGTLCAGQSRVVLSQITGVFRDCVTDCVRRALAGDFSVKRVELPAIEQQIFRYGRSLIAAGQHLRSWSTDGVETGRDLVLAIICDWLDEGPQRAITVALLEMAARHAPTGHWLRRIEVFWRHGDRAVQRAAVDAILGAGEAAAGLALSLSRLVDAPSPRIVERGLEAIEAFDAKWAEPMVLGALARPEMAVKRAAASALMVIASPAAVPTILDWLARHDNRALRTALKAAFKTAAGTARPALLMAAFEAEADPRRRGLLLDALDGLLPLAGLLRLSRTAHASADTLVDAALDGRLTLADASQAQVAARLHRLRVREAPEADDPTEDLRVRGFTPERAQAVLAEWVETQDARCAQAVSDRMAEWLAWCAAGALDDASADIAAELALRFASGKHVEMLDALLALAPRVSTPVALRFMARCVVDPSPAQRQRAIGVVRALPDAPEPGGLRRFAQLETLGAVLTRADVWRCLQECAMGPDFARRSELLLIRALQLPNPGGTPMLAPAALRLLEGAAEWHRLPDADRAGWLDAALKARPLGVSPLGDVPVVRERSPLSTAELVAALADPNTRDEAAQTLTHRSTAAAVWPGVLLRVLAGEFKAPVCLYSALAQALHEWPTDSDAQDIAMHWIGWLEPAQQRRFIPGWIAARARGDAQADACLQAATDAVLLPFVWAGKDADPTLARLLSQHDVDSESMRGLIAWLQAHAPQEATRFERPPKPVIDDAVVDPIAGLDADGLRRLIHRDDAAVGLVVRAVHALAASKDVAIEPIAGLVVDARPKVRSAALRALKTIAPRARSLDATCDALRIEDRNDVILQLMRSLGHGRHLPGLPLLVDRLVHRKLKIAEGAREALVGFGEAALPALEHAARRARPDRRDAYRAVIAAIEG